MIFIYDGLEKVLYNGDVKWDKSEMIINEPKLGSINSNWLSDQLELYDNSSKSLPKEKEEGENEMKKEMSIQEMFENITAIRGALMNLKNGGIEIFFEEETMSFCKDELCVDLYHTWYETK